MKAPAYLFVGFPNCQQCHDSRLDRAWRSSLRRTATGYVGPRNDALDPIGRFADSLGDLGDLDTFGGHAEHAPFHGTQMFHQTPFLVDSTLPTRTHVGRNKPREGLEKNLGPLKGILQPLV